MRKLLPVAALLLVLFVSASYAQEETEAEPGAAVRDRAGSDAALLLPQSGVGGSPKIALSKDDQKQTELKIEVEGCEELRGYYSAPIGASKSHKHALVFSFTSGGSDIAEELTDVARLSSGHDPIIFVSVKYVREKEVGEGFYLIEDMVEDDKLWEACDWLLAKALTDQPVDPTRCFLLGISGGEDKAGDWARHLWASDPDKFPFRARLFHGPTFEKDMEGLPPVPAIFSVTGFDVDMLKQFGTDDTPRRMANKLRAAGIPAQYHEYGQLDDIGLFMNDERWVQIHRAAINTLGGPGPEEYPPDEKRYLGAPTDADKLPWTEHKDPWANEVIAMATAEDWKGAWERGNGIMNDKNVKSKEKRDLKDFMKEFEKYVKDELERLDKSLQLSIKNDFWPNTWHHQRMKAMHKAFKDESWYSKKGYAATLETIKTFGPAQRDKARKEKMFEAVKLELAGKRDEAKKIYETLVRDKSEDGGVSEWPHAAEYRLSWWDKVE
ncbi:MAG: hypothetical protein K8I27_10275 [Planctomycetes bacterium]|nr:hypothetical protein [Planctomycetota bacterium]